MTSEVLALLEGASALLLDFDGPLAALMPPPANAQAADAALAVLDGVELPNDIATTTDHLAVLRWSLEHLPAPLMLEVEAACTQAEVAAAADCREAVNCSALFEHAERAGLPVGVVSNNAAAAVRAFLQRTGRLGSVEVISARTPDTVEWLKPRPELLLTAAVALRVNVGEVVFVGDAVSDVIASKRVGCRSLGLYKNASRKAELEEAGADAVWPIDSQVAIR
ncbi:HAD family hydrolase [Nocardioides sp.]|uniref:HAD family hydrolase n=1 Tax=Nocardioides sp. TaxID=35761 RepID=UPI002CB0ADA1|nr:HAD hydrolase-like protein [Nocardioides sp.]HSX67120.1 HAD hydrolase-like protein [Nocardioides sp.]